MLFPPRSATRSGICAVPGGGGGGGASNKESNTHLPRLTGEVRVGFDVAVSTLACASTPPPRAASTGTRIISFEVGAAIP